MTICTRYFKKWLMLLATILIAQVAAKAQIIVQGYGQLNAQPDGAYTVCGAAETDTIYLKNTNGGNISAINITLHLPPGGSYVTGSIAAGGTGVTGAIDANITNLNAPVITVNGTVASNNVFKIWYNKTFTCPVIAYQAGGGLAKETFDFSYTGGTAQTAVAPVGTYNIKAASLNLTSVTNNAYTGFVGDSFTQTYTITNGGQGCTNSAYLVLDNGGGTYSFSAPTKGTLSHDTLFLTAADLPGGILCNAQNMTVTVTTKLLNCIHLPRVAIVGWGCGAGSYCQPTTASNSNNSNVTITNATPNLKVSVPNWNFNMCYTGDLIKETMRIVNTGAGPATNLVNLFDVGVVGNAAGQTVYDTSVAWVIKNKAGAVIGNVSNFNTFTYLTPNSIFDANCNPINNLFLKLKGSLQNIIIAPNDTIYIDFYLRSNNKNCINSCVSSIYHFEQNSTLSYANQCGAGSYQISNSFSSYSEFIQLIDIAAPTDIVGGTPFNISLQYGLLQTNNNPNGKGKVYLILPGLASLGFMPTVSTVTKVDGIGSGTVLNVAVKSDTMWIGPFPENFNLSNGKIVIPFMPVCGTGGPKTLNFTHLVQYDSSCANGYMRMGCNSTTVNLHCPNPCPKGGATPVNFSLLRKNYGGVDNNNDGLPDASGTIDVTKINLHGAVNGDTLLGVWNIKVNPNSDATDANVNQPFNYTYIDFDLGAAPQSGGYYNTVTNYMSPVPNASVTIYPFGGGTPITCTVTPTIIGSKAHYDFSACKVQWNGGDSMVVNALFKVNDYFYGSVGITNHYVEKCYVYSSYVAKPTANTAPIDYSTYTCDNFQDYINLYNIWTQTYVPSIQGDIYACNNSLRGRLTQFTRTQTDPDLFPYEYRNFATPNIFYVVIPHGTTFRAGTGVLKDDNNSNTYNIPNANIIQIGDTVIFSNLKAAFVANGGTWIPTDEKADYDVLFSVDVPCSVAVGTYVGAEAVDWIGNGINTPVNYVGYQTYIGNNYPLNNTNRWYNYNLAYRVYQPQPVLAGGGTVTTNTGTASWTIQMQNLSNNVVAANSYLYITPVNSFTNIVISEGGTPLVKTAAGFYQLGNLAASASRTFTVTAQLGSCSIDSFRIYQGYGCVGYPTSFIASACNQSTWLVASGYNAGLDATFSRVGTGDISLCNPPFTVEALINSTLTGNLGSDTLRVILPPFSSYVAGTDSVSNYPTGTVLAQTAYNPTIIHSTTGDTLIFALNNLTAGLGLTGVGDLAHSKVGVRFAIATQCGFTSGAPIKATISGISVCGDLTAIVNKATNGITLAGATPTNQFSVNYTATSTPCSATATVSVINTGTVPTNANDSLIITLPAGGVLASSSITAIHNSPVVAATSTTISVYKWPIPVGLAVGDSMKFSFPIDLTQVACGPQISTANAIQNINLLCNGNSCSTPVIVGGKDVTITVAKPTLVINNIVAQNINGWLSGGSGTLAVTLTNTSAINLPASTYNVEYFCGSSTTPMAAALFPAAVAAGATVTANMSVISSASCLPGTTVTGKIRPVGAFGAVCLCNSTSFIMASTLPINLLNLSASKLSSNQVKVGWQVGVVLNLASYDVERSIDGSTFSKVNNTTATGRTNYNCLDNIAGISSKYVYYRLKMINNDGTFKYSQIVKVNIEFTDMGMVIYPNPVHNQMLVTINSGITQKAELRLVNNLGQTLQTQQLNLVTGANSVTVDNINRLRSAAYIVVVYFSNGEVLRAKVIKE